LTIFEDSNDKPAQDILPASSPTPSIKELALVTPKCKKEVGRHAKHGSHNTRVIPSSVPINVHFPVSKGQKTPRTLRFCDKLSPPETPKHRTALPKCAPVTPKQQVLQVATGTPKTAITPGTPGLRKLNPYTQARQLFSRSDATNALIGRDEEKRQLTNFISDRLNNERGGCVYISGPPGTGKSALVDEVLQSLSTDQSAATCTINCMSIRNATDLSNKLSEDLSLDAATTAGDDALSHLKSALLSGQDGATPYIVILDEVDRLVDLDLKLLYSLFEWSMHASSRLILIGIANALDLTDRLLPRLKSRNIKPDLLPFMPYNSPQIVQIITTKLRSLSDDSATPVYVPIMHPAAILLCSKKVAAQTGDLRKSFDVCRRAIDLVEQEAKADQAKLALQDSPSKHVLAENPNLSSPPVSRSPSKSPHQLRLSSSLSHLTAATAPRATIAHVAKVTSAIFSNGTTQRLANLNLQQKAVLCALAGIEKKRRESRSNSIFATPSKNDDASPTIKQLYDMYSNICNREKLLHPLTSVEFRDVVGGLETLSLVSMVEGKGRSSSFAFPMTPSKTPSRRGRDAFAGMAVGGAASEKRVSSSVGHQELLGSLVGAGSEILKEILDGVGVV